MKTKLIEGIASVKHAGRSCNGLIPWESPYIIFDVEGVEYTWHTDNMHDILHKMDRLDFDIHMKQGRWFDVKMRVRQNRVWRIIELSYR